MQVSVLSWSFLLFFVFFSVADAKKKVKEADPRDCEVCVSNLEAIDKLIPADKKGDKLAVEKAINTHCTLSGFGSEWKPNPNLASPKDVKMCYIFEPIKKSISQPFATGMPKKKVCERLKKDNPEVCEVKYRKLFLYLISSYR
jgi:mesencephalic astrocyte-derived neurotrophic factor